jgi:Tol biopolymer transport system component
LASLIAALAFMSATPSYLPAQTTTRVNLSSGGAQGNLASYAPRVSYNGQRVVYHSVATNLVSGDTNAHTDVFLQKLSANTITRVSVDSSGTQGNGESGYPDISGDGRYVVYESAATNLIAGGTTHFQIFMYDTTNATTVLISTDSSGTHGNGDSITPSLSADGRYVAFGSVATNLVAADTNGTSDIFVHDNSNGTTIRVNVDSSGNQATILGSGYPRISGNGQFVCFQSGAANLVANDNNGVDDVFVHDLGTGATVRASLDSSVNQVEGNAASGTPDISYDGQFVVFGSQATNLDAINADTNGFGDVFVRDAVALTTVRVNLVGNLQGNGNAQSQTMSADGTVVAFASQATNIVAGDTNGVADIFSVNVVNVGALAPVLASQSTGGALSNAATDSGFPALSTDGRFVCYESVATNLVANDTNGYQDIFERDTATTQFVSFCSPGLAGVMSCPCSNPPAGAGTGCDNSSGTGGAQLSSSGTASIANDNLVFATAGEKPTATSEFTQGTSTIAAGTTFGQGVRCVGGTLKRLYTKTASGGVATAPDFSIPDLSVSAMSSSLGDTLTPGTVRYYFVYYRDPTVLGGCSPLATFTATQSGAIAWAP